MNEQAQSVTLNLFESINIEIMNKIIEIISEESKFSVLKNKRNHFMKIKQTAKKQLASSERNAMAFGMYDDCGTDYINDEKEAEFRNGMVKDLETFLSEDEVLNQSRLVGSLKKIFKTKHPEHCELMLKMLSFAQKKREKNIQFNLKRKKIIYSSAANIAMALNGYLKEAKENEVVLDKITKEKLSSVCSTTGLTNHKNPVKELPEYFRIYPKKIIAVVQLEKETVLLPMAKERKILINTLLCRIEKNSHQYTEG